MSLDINPPLLRFRVEEGIECCTRVPKSTSAAGLLLIAITACRGVFSRTQPVAIDVLAALCVLRASFLKLDIVISTCPSFCFENLSRGALGRTALEWSTNVLHHKKVY